MTVPFIKQPTAQPSTTAPAEPGRLSGLGRVLIVVYVVLTLAAGFRSLYQIIAKFDEAPLAYSLSALAAAVYLIATIALIRRNGVWRKVAWIALSFELVGVLVVGTLSLTTPQLFGHPSVWSVYGQGYLFIPLVLPVLGLLLLRGEAKQQANGSVASDTNGVADSREGTRAGL